VQEFYVFQVRNNLKPYRSISIVLIMFIEQDHDEEYNITICIIIKQ